MYVHVSVVEYAVNLQENEEIYLQEGPGCIQGQNLATLLCFNLNLRAKDC